VVGATAVGKSDLGVALARALDGEIVNADSMQLYRGMDIGTAKLTVEERQGVPHHLLDIWPVTTAASVAEYQLLARDAVREIAERGRRPIIVGGSGLYVRALLDDFAFPGTDADIRNDLEMQLEEQGSLKLHERLASLDPAAAQAILPTNGRRVVRALEVIELTGQPFTATLPGPTPVIDAIHIGVEVDRPTLDRRITERVQRMWAGGLVEEVEGLLDHGILDGVTASRALGYAQVLRHFTDDSYDETAARVDTDLATRRFARRQERWFKRDPRITWLAGQRADLFESALALVND